MGSSSLGGMDIVSRDLSTFPHWTTVWDFTRFVLVASGFPRSVPLFLLVSLPSTSILRFIPCSTFIHSIPLQFLFHWENLGALHLQSMPHSAERRHWINLERTAWMILPRMMRRLSSTNLFYNCLDTSPFKQDLTLRAGRDNTFAFPTSLPSASLRKGTQYIFVDKLMNEHRGLNSNDQCHQQAGDDRVSFSRWSYATPFLHSLLWL